MIENFGKPFVIAEIGSNHNGDMDLARLMIDAAVDSGADAVKFQSFTPTSLIAKEEYDRNQTYDDSPKKHFGSLKAMVDKYYLRTEQHFELAEYSRSKGIEFCSTPFSLGEVDLLEELNVPFYKIASMDVNNPPLLEKVGKTGKPVIMSTGMATLGEVEEAVKILEGTGNDQIVLLHCISIYPPDPKDINLRNITTLQEMFDYPIGFSDHSIGTAIPLASVALGACVIEKHFTTDRDMEGWDHDISADPPQMKVIASESKIIAESMGSFRRVLSPAEEEKKLKFRRSLVTLTDLPAGHVLQESDLTSKRPALGIPPNLMHVAIGRKLKQAMPADSVIRWEDLA